ncbi:MaoC family dehydratase [Cellulosimicrobium sp. PMB13]|uniref:MaoC family dehydratase n=1 Tax=Cellulosimicrobium sp. PMB13 TaxID=3120158 RepID=UPI003F4BCEE3
MSTASTGPTPAPPTPQTDTAIRVASVADLPSAVGRSATSERWVVVDQARIDAFADVTEDHQWIHVDPERAAAGPFGAPVAHGYLTLSLLPVLTAGLLDVGGVAMHVNYGLDSVRFLTPVRAGSRVRATSTVTGVDDSPRGARVRIRVSVEVEGAESSDKPALVADTVVLVVPA